MYHVSQNPTEPCFVQNPYSFYAEMQMQDELVFWSDYDMPAVFDFETCEKLFKDKRLGREAPPDQRPKIAPHTQPFYDVEAHSMLELEPPRHTRLRNLVLRAFTSRKIKELAPDIIEIAQSSLDHCDPEADVIQRYATRIPIVVICRLLGVPESMADDLLKWSNAMVMMYQARRTHALELAAANAAQEFSDFMRQYVDERRSTPADDLITHLIAAEQDGQKLTTDELITTSILLLNAGHEATVHTMGNGIKTILETQTQSAATHPETVDTLVEEILRFDPPLHMFTRYLYEDMTIKGAQLSKGDQIALVIGAAGRDPRRWSDPNTFDPNRPIRKNLAFGGGIHFCIGAPLARLELSLSLPILFQKFPNLTLVETPTYANVYHFHGLERLKVRTA